MSFRLGAGAKSASSVGMMEGAFFVSRTDLLAWVNGLLGTSLTKVEQCASGAVYCQIIDSCHPNTIAMRKVNWMARSDHEFIPNYKVLQAAFDKNGIDRHVDVDKLIRAKYQDNLEFLQWMKCYWEHEGHRHASDYDPHLVREGKQLPAWAQGGAVETSMTRAPAREKENLRPRPAPAAEKRPPSGRSTPTAAPPAAAPPQNRERVAPGAHARAPRPANTAGDQELEALRTRAAGQEEEIEELRNALEGLEVERDYYFRKLREVEILCTSLQTQQEASGTKATPEAKIVADVQAILYAETEDEPGDGAAPQ